RDGGSAVRRQLRARITGRIRDSLTEEVNELARSLGRGDNTKLSEYLDSVREIEQRIQNTETQGQQAVELPERPVDVPATFEEHVKLMFDLQVLAYRAD